MPKGGGSIRGIGETFIPNAVTGSGTISVPIAVSPGRSGFGPQLSLSYDSNAGNGPFGFGWNLPLPAIRRKTDRGLPVYRDAEDSDVFTLSEAEDLVPVFRQDGQGEWVRDADGRLVDDEEEIDGYLVRRYRPRVEGLFARIERWTHVTSGDVHWRTISRDNVLTLYGRDQRSRVFDPADSRRVFAWLICETRDDKGNGIIYDYKAEDGEGVDLGQVHERNRGEPGARERATARYIKRIRYGNRVTLLDSTGRRPRFLTPAARQDAGWMFDVVFDYGEHDANAPTPNDSGPWLRRHDPFSTYRSGFEVRTARLCQRVLMFHHFPAEAGVGENCLVRSTDIVYRSTRGDTRDSSRGDPIASFIASITQRGYQRRAAGGYVTRALPPLEFGYSEAVVDGVVHEIDSASLQNLPVGSDGTNYRWVDLDGEGLAGLLAEQAGAWFYKPNLGRGRFGPLEPVSPAPSLTALAGGRQQLVDLAGDGLLDVVEFSGSTAGFYERTSEGGWGVFRPFAARPNVPWDGSNLRFIDLTGDGLADVLLTEHEAFTWYPSRGEDGFGEARRTPQPLDEERGPRLVFADSADSVFLADLSGDGLADLVRIRNGEVCYWPNLGYGRFGAKVTMDHAPLFDHPEQFDPRRVRLADIDGTGAADLIYLGRDGVRVYANESGNRWSEVRLLPQLPHLGNIASVMVADLLGNGTACLVWSSALPRDARSPVRYVDLMGGRKPHLLEKVVNNLGGEIHVQYAPSTQFYLADKAAGRPWATRLPFPVHVVERSTIVDRWRGTEFSTSYSYHHGYFDGLEREFRGFGRVEQIDTERFGVFARGNRASPYITDDLTLYQPPVKTVTWFHTGAAGERHDALPVAAAECFPAWLERRDPARASDLAAFREAALPPPDLNGKGLSADEWREALRACKGMMLRREVYELDVDAWERHEHKEVRLFTTAYHSCHIEPLQPRAHNRHAVFLVTESEAITYHYELDLQAQTLTVDPRVAHTLNVALDEYGHVLQAVSAVYGRHGAHQDPSLTPDQHALIRSVQQEPHLAYAETKYTRDAEGPDTHRVRVPCRIRTYELTGISKTGPYVTLAELRGYQLDGTPRPGATPVQPLSYHERADNLTPQKRLVEHSRVLFFGEDLQPLPFGVLGSLGLTYETYTLALTEPLLTAVLGSKLTPEVTAALSTPEESGYVSGAAVNALYSAGETEPHTGEFWIRSGIAGFTANAALEFFLPERYIDPFGNVTALVHEALHRLHVRSSTDARGNTVTVERFDFRVLAPGAIKDANDNVSEVFFDALGCPVAMAVRGKGQEGDSLQGFDETTANPTNASLLPFFATVPFSQQTADALLGTATARYVYSFGTNAAGGLGVPGSHPACACTISRDTHAAAAAGGRTRTQTAFAYTDGLGAAIATKIQAEPETSGGALRWIASGKTILNNKGKPVKQYEPYFSPPDVGHRFSEPQEVGVTPVLYYDSAGRLIRTEFPDGTVTRVAFSPWATATFDANDTVLEPGNAWYARMSAVTATVEERRAARLAAKVAGTPTRTILDSLGREVIVIAHNRAPEPIAPLGQPVAADDPARVWREERALTFTKLDAEGKPLWVRDGLGKLVVQYISPAKANDDASDGVAAGTTTCYDVAGNLLYQHSMDAGDRWMVADAAGKPLFGWDFNRRRDLSGQALDEQRLFRTRRDALRRPTGTWLSVNGGKGQQIERLEYVDAGSGVADAKPRNLCGQLVRRYDASGLRVTDRLDFKGNTVESRRQPTNQYTAAVIDWSAADPTALLDSEVFTQQTQYDALNRPTRLFNWHLGSGAPVAVYEPTYNARGLLEREEIVVRATKTDAGVGYLEGGDSERIAAIEHVTFNAKGQKEHVRYGNRTATRYTYDDRTFRLIQLFTRRDGAFTEDCGGDPASVRTAAPDAGPTPRPCGVQNLRYTYDAAGNITRIQDDAQPSIYFQNARVDPSCEYVYDALNRLIEATGREHGARVGAPRHIEAAAGHAIPDPDPNAVRRYRQIYAYDAAGNLRRMKHEAGLGSWTRDYDYATDSNRLTGAATDDPAEAVAYRYDLHGNMLNLARTLPGLDLRWDYRDMVAALDLEGGGWAYYTYDAGRQRTRKRLERSNNVVEDRLDLGGLEIARRYVNGALVERIESIHLFQGGQRVLLIDDVLETNRASLPTGPLYRYQYVNHLGSACVELNDQASVISYEEYHPYGTSAYRLMNARIEVPARRYRHGGMERDEESGLSYHGARYLDPVLGRWIACDPLGTQGGMNLYAGFDGNPIGITDTTGTQPRPYNFVETVASLEQGLSRIRDLGIDRAREFGLARDPGTGEFMVLQGGSRSVDFGRFEAWAHTHTGEDTTSSPSTADLNTLSDASRPQAPRHFIYGSADNAWTELVYNPAERSFRAFEYLDDLNVRTRLITLNPKISPVEPNPAIAFTRWTSGPSEMFQPEGSVAKAPPVTISTPLDAGLPGPDVVTRGPLLSGLGGKLTVGAFGVLGVLGSLAAGLEVGTGIDKAFSGKGLLGGIDIGEGLANLGLIIGGPKLVEAGLMKAGGGAGMTLAAGLAAGMGVWALASSLRAAVKGEAGPVETMRQMYGVPTLFDIHGLLTGNFEKQKSTPLGVGGVMERFLWNLQWENLTFSSAD